MKNFLSIPITGNDDQGNPVGDKENVLIKASDISLVAKKTTSLSLNGNAYSDYQIIIEWIGKPYFVTIKHGADPQGGSSNTMIEYIQDAIASANQSRGGDTLHVLNPPFNIWSVATDY